MIKNLYEVEKQLDEMKKLLSCAINRISTLEMREMRRDVTTDPSFVKCATIPKLFPYLTKKAVEVFPAPENVKNSQASYSVAQYLTRECNLEKFKSLYGQYNYFKRESVEQIEAQLKLEQQ